MVGRSAGVRRGKCNVTMGGRVGVAERSGEEAGEGEVEGGSRGTARVMMGCPVLRELNVCEVGVVVMLTSEGCSCTRHLTAVSFCTRVHQLSRSPLLPHTCALVERSAR